jgi:hypothetical protein
LSTVDGSGDQVCDKGLPVRRGELDLETSKTDFEAVFDVTLYPLFQQALASVPASERHGPLVTHGRGATPLAAGYGTAKRQTGSVDWISPGL